MKNFAKLLFYNGVFIMTFFSSCDTNNASDVSCGCESEVLVKVASQVNGRIDILSKQHPDTWVIVSEEGIIGEDSPVFDGPDLVAVCNFPDSLKIQGQEVVFSAHLKESCKDYETWSSKVYVGRLTAISLFQNGEEK